MESAFHPPFKFTVRTLLLFTVILAVVFATWRLASSADLLVYVVGCEIGAAAGIILTNIGRRRVSVLRGTLGGAIGGGTGLVLTLLGLIIFLDIPAVSGLRDLGITILVGLFWGAVGGVFGSVFGMLVASLVSIFAVRVDMTNRDYLSQSTCNYRRVRVFLQSLEQTSADTNDAR